MTLSGIDMLVPVPAQSKLEAIAGSYKLNRWRVLYTGFVYAEFEFFYHFNLNLVNFIFQLSNFVHAKFEALHSIHF